MEDAEFMMELAAKREAYWEAKHTRHQEILQHETKRRAQMEAKDSLEARDNEQHENFRLSLAEKRMRETAGKPRSPLLEATEVPPMYQGWSMSPLLQQQPATMP